MEITLSLLQAVVFVLLAFCGGMWLGLELMFWAAERAVGKVFDSFADQRSGLPLSDQHGTDPAGRGK